jgi:formamidopyrimidine-DNA glycosylase
MPELPEVQTTVNGLSRAIVGLKIVDAWSDYISDHYTGSSTIKDRAYFRRFKKTVIGQTIASVERRAKNILIRLEPNGETIVIHMKMTGHIMIGRYLYDGERKAWRPAPDERASLHDPFNRFIHFALSLSDERSTERQLVLSDMRKFGTVSLLSDRSSHLERLGPEPLSPDFAFEAFKDRLDRKPAGKIKTVLMDQTIISGIGNIYSDEALWRAGVHPEQRVADIPDMLLKRLYRATVDVLSQGIDFGGDSMSDYRNVDGERGSFQGQHRAYRKTGSRCSFLIGSGSKAHACPGIIMRKIVNGRSAHFCSTHQPLIDPTADTKKRRQRQRRSKTPSSHGAVSQR